MIQNRFCRALTSLPRRGKQAVVMAVDCGALMLALWLAFSLRLETFYVPDGAAVAYFVAAPLVAVPVFVRLGLYRAIFRYIGWRALASVVLAVGVYGALLGAGMWLWGKGVVPRSVILINILMALLLVGGNRMVARWWFGSGAPRVGTGAERYGRKPVVIYGAGAAGAQLVSALGYSRELLPVAMVDDDPSLHGHHVFGLTVYPPADFAKVVDRLRVEEVLLAIPSAPRHRRKEIVAWLERFPVHVRTVPGVAEMAQGKVRVQDLREVDIDDLLGRDVAPPDDRLLTANIRGRSVMVTGAGGSIGSELCRQVLKHDPLRIVLFELSEFALYGIDLELREAARSRGQSVEIIPLLGSVNHQHRIEHVMSAFGVETVYHAAAYKHVPLVEFNPIEGIRNNVFGTLRTAQAAVKAGVKTFVLISTDKAVRPTNVMGATKRLAELILQALAREHQNITFSMVRFGNVLGSSGSVVPLFRSQLKAGGPITLTHPEITRYFMTIPEASQLVIQAGAMGTGGDVFVLDMGRPVKIIDLARRMIHLSGLEVKDEQHPDGEIEIEITGLRPGEKLYEELLIGDNVTGTTHPLIMRAEEELIPWSVLKEVLGEIDEACHAFDLPAIRSLLLKTVKGYQPTSGIEDLIWSVSEKTARSIVAAVESAS